MDKIGQYEILETLHMGAQPLYRAKAPDGRIVAVKTTPVKSLTPESRERFLREAETCRGLDHPNLVKVLESGEANGVLFQVVDSDMPVGSAIDFTILLPADVVGAETDVRLDCKGRVVRNFEESGRHGVGVVIDEYRFDRQQ